MVVDGGAETVLTASSARDVPTDPTSSTDAVLRIGSQESADEEIAGFIFIDVFGHRQSGKDVALREFLVVIGKRLEGFLQNLVGRPGAEREDKILFRAGDGEWLADWPASLADQRLHPYPALVTDGHGSFGHMPVAHQENFVAAFSAAGDPSDARHTRIGGVPFPQPRLGGERRRIGQHHPCIDFPFPDAGNPMPVIRRCGRVLGLVRRELHRMEPGLRQIEKEKRKPGRALGFNPRADQPGPTAPREDRNVSMELDEFEKIGQMRPIIRRGKHKAAADMATRLMQRLARRLDDGLFGIRTEDEAGSGGIWHWMIQKRGDAVARTLIANMEQVRACKRSLRSFGLKSPFILSCAANSRTSGGIRAFFGSTHFWVFPPLIVSLGNQRESLSVRKGEAGRPAALIRLQSGLSAHP